MRVYASMIMIGWAFATASLAQTTDGQTSAKVQWVKTPSDYMKRWGWGQSSDIKAEGEAVLKCSYSVRGILNDCVVVKDVATNRIDFGDYALVVAKSLRLKPVLSDGSPLTPGSVTFTIPFRQADKIKSGQGIAISPTRGR